MSPAGSRPLLLLDVDGVLLVVREPGDDDALEAEPTLHPDAARWMAELSGVFDLAWATTWHDLGTSRGGEALKDY